ncbi:MAG: 3'-5' exoribonuclease [Proteobacteria bacterium]|nr:3'-5' exoribonuclease [Pseudomonadota bacterium]
MKLTNPFYKFIFFSALTSSIVIGSLLFFLWRDFTPEQIQSVFSIAKDHSAYFICILLFGCIIMGSVLEIIHTTYIKPFKKISAEASVIYSSNPSHRIKISGNSDLKQLACIINNFADIFENLNKTITDQILAARKETEKERNLLADIMSELPQGVFICNKNGRIILFNSLAKKLFTHNSPAIATEQFIGLGRSIFHLIDKTLITQALKEINDHLICEASSTAACFRTPIHTGHILDIETIHILDAKKNMTGFILALVDITDKIDRYNTIRDMLRSFGQVLKNIYPNHFSDRITSEFDLMTAQILNRLSNRTPPPSSSDEISRPPVITGSRPEFYDFNLFKNEDENIDLMDMDLTRLTYTVLDTETTGLSPDQGDEIISIGAVRIVNSRITYQDIFDQLVNPKRDIPIESYKVHGITYEMVAEKNDINTILPVFKQFVADTVLIGHNIAFDMKMLKVKEKTTGVQFINPVLDTLLLSAILHPDHEHHDLESIALRLGVEIVGRHTALGDAIATAQIFLKLLPILNNSGIFTLKEAIKASRKSYYARLKY